MLAGMSDHSACEATLRVADDAMVTAAAFRQRVAVFQKQIDLPALHRITMN
jgi:uncharacterized protein YqiB (DUF1249 family)